MIVLKYVTLALHVALQTDSQWLTLTLGLGVYGHPRRTNWKAVYLHGVAIDVNI